MKRQFSCDPFKLGLREKKDIEKINVYKEKSFLEIMISCSSNKYILFWPLCDKVLIGTNCIRCFILLSFTPHIFVVLCSFASSCLSSIGLGISTRPRTSRAGNIQNPPSVGLGPGLGLYG